MEYTIKAKPTLYNGILYRSRLEARWAAFFDLASISFIYEPIDFPGWSPDFLIQRRWTDINILIEVKPITHPDTVVMEKIRQSITAAKWDGPVIVLGVCPLGETKACAEYKFLIGHDTGYQIGWFYRKFDGWVNPQPAISQFLHRDDLMPVCNSHLEYCWRRACTVSRFEVQ